MMSLLRALPASTAEMLAAFGDGSLMEGALAFERALARAEAAEGIIPEGHAATIESCCAPENFDVASLAEAAAHAGTLAIPLVKKLRGLVGRIDPAASASVHRGATSQDVSDTALMLQAKAGLALLTADLSRLRTHLAALVQAHAATPMLGRTLLQAAQPITFGLKLAGWLSGLDAAAARLSREATPALALQFGGATGTRAGLAGKGTAIASRIAATLDLENPVLPWHAQRDRVAGLGTALAILIGALGKIARDISLLSQGETAEAFEPRLPGRGGSSTMAHKRNPTGCQVALSAAFRAPGLAATLLASLPTEHERGLGGWQAEAPVLAELFLLCHGGLSAMLPVVAGLEVDASAMLKNLQHASVGTETGEAEALALAMLAVREPE
jgi:3-carboxy-cis,cis-muconate cycloisomerase